MSSDSRNENDPYSLHARLGISLFFVFAVLLIVSNFFNFPKYESPVNEPLARTSKEIIRGNVSKKQVIFTFDGGSGDISTEQVLGTLAKHKVKGTFFLTGEFIKTYQAVTRKIAAGGNEIFNHTYDHKYLTDLNSGEIRREFSRTDQELKRVVGQGFSTKPYFRAPYGSRDRRVISVAFGSGYQSVYWTIDAGDWKESGEGITRAEVEDRILSNLAPGNIYLMHLGDSITGAILDDVFSKIEARGYKIVSLIEGVQG